MDEQIDIDTISEYCPKNGDEEKIKNIVLNYGTVDSVEKTFELNDLLISEESDSMFASFLFSPKLIALLLSSASIQVLDKVMHFIENGEKE